MLLVREYPKTLEKNMREMMKRTIKKQVWLNRTEARELQKKAKKVCLSEAGLVRMLISGYEPRQQPDESFYELAGQLSAVGNSLNQIAAKAHSLGYIDEVKYEEEARRLHMLQADLEEAVLTPVKRSF